MDPRPIVNEAKAKELAARGKVAGKDFVLSKVCMGEAGGRHCLMCGRYIVRRDQRCR